jgi:hypothetical protein
MEKTFPPGNAVGMDMGVHDPRKDEMPLKIEDLFCRRALPRSIQTGNDPSFDPHRGIFGYLVREHEISLHQ